MGLNRPSCELRRAGTPLAHHTGMTKVLVGAVLLWFSYLTVSVLGEHGYAGFLALARANSATRLLLIDVTIFIVLVGAWMLKDAKRPLWGVPFVALAAAFGAAGPLLYLLLRSWIGSTVGSPAREDGHA